MDLKTIGIFSGIFFTAVSFWSGIGLAILRNHFISKNDLKVSDIMLKTDFKKEDFMTKEQFDREQITCQAHLCEKIDTFATEIKSQISVIDKKRESGRDENLKFLKAIYKHMGSVEQFMETHEKRVKAVNGD